MFLILLKCSEVPLLSFTSYPSVACAAHDDVGQPMISQSKGGKIWWKRKREALIFQESQQFVVSGFISSMNLETNLPSDLHIRIIYSEIEQ